MEPTSTAQRGRPRKWESEIDKHRAHRARKAEKLALLDQLLQAVRNARLDDPELQAAVTAAGDEDAALVTALIGHFQDRR
jgi:hypothetical protein